MANAPSTPVTPSASVPSTPVVGTPAKGADPKAVVGAPVIPAKGAPAVEETWDVQENGKTVKKSRKEIVEAYQLRQLSDKKRSEAEKTTAEYNKLFEVYKKDPIRFMKATGVDFENLATSFLAKKAEEAMRDPKDLEMERVKAENVEYKKWQEEQKTNKERLDKDAAIGVEKQRIHSEIVQAIEESKELGLPIDEELVIAIAQKMMLQDKAKKPLNAKEALPAAYASTQKWLQGMASKMEGEAIVKWLGEDVAKKIRKYDLTQLKAKRKDLQTPAGTAVKPNSERKEVKAKPYRTWSEFKASNLDTIK